MKHLEVKDKNIQFHYSEDLHDLLARVQEEYDWMKESKKEMYNIMQEWDKDAEIQKAKDEVRQLRKNALLILSDKEKEEETEFRNWHWKHCAEPLHSKTKGNTYIYEISGTGLGAIIKITCPICGQTKDITDIESW